MSELLKAQVELSCPQCGRKLRVTLGDIQCGRTVTCLGGHQVTLQQEGHGIQQADKALNELEKSIKQINRKFRLG